MSDLSKMKVTELRSALKEVGLKTTGNKEELVKRLGSNIPKEQKEMMTKLPKDIIIQIALELNLPDLFSLCLSSKRMNDATCDNETFWRQKFVRDRRIIKGEKDVSKIDSPKEYYKERHDTYIKFLTEKLFEFVEKGNLEGVIKAVNKGADVNYNIEGNTPTVEAARRGHLEIVKYLLEHGAIYLLVNALFAAVFENHNDVAKYLIEKGVDYLDAEDSMNIEMQRFVHEYEETL